MEQPWTVFLCCEAIVICSNTHVSACSSGWCQPLLFRIQLSATDVSARTTMKGAAKCDKHRELQNSVNRQGLERILCFWGSPRKHAYFSVHLLGSSSCCPVWACCCDCLCLEMCAGTPEAFDSHGFAAPACKNKRLVCTCVALCCCIRLLIFARLPSSLDMKLGWQTR